jgi:ABC-2 type transport system ATP-binding protein
MAWLLWDIPPIDAFYLNKAIYSIPADEFKKTLDYMVEMLSVGDVMRKPTRQLSLGERMKCEFIMAMLHKPSIVFLDEPTIGLDVVAKDRIRDFILEMNRNGTTFILATHDLGDVEQLARRVMVINNGKIAFDDSMENLKSRLGNIKTIKLLTETPLPSVKMNGIKLIKHESDYEEELELDATEVSMNSFIELINKNCVIKDLSISAPPIEHIIKELYEEASQAG